MQLRFPLCFRSPMSWGCSRGFPLHPFFVTIAFAASADFMTPIGYQTNLMVFGPGNYRFADYTKIGLPLTLIYGILVISFIHFYYF